MKEYLKLGCVSAVFLLILFGSMFVGVVKFLAWWRIAFGA